MVGWWFLSRSLVRSLFLSISLFLSLSLSGWLGGGLSLSLPLSHFLSLVEVRVVGWLPLFPLVGMGGWVVVYLSLGI